jgi:predicted PurR-regulated permease PerM
MSAESGRSVEAAPSDHDRVASRQFTTRLGLAVLLAGLLYLVWQIVSPLWQPLLWAVLLGALLAPLTGRLSQRLGDRPQLAASIVTALTVLLFVIPVAVIAAAVIGQARQLLHTMETKGPLPSTHDFNLSTIPWLQQGIDWIGTNIGVSLQQMQDWTVAGAKRLLESMVSSGGSVVLGALGTVVSFTLMLFVLFFVLRDGPRVAQAAVRLLPIEPQRRSRLWHHLAEVTRAVFMGIGLTALVQGVLLGVGFRIAGVPSPLLFGALGVVLSLVPFVGTVLLWGPAAIWLAARGEYGAATFLTAWGTLLVGSVDNFLRPFLISGQAAVPTLAVFIGVMGGLAAFGFIGLFLGPIVLGMVVALFRFETEQLDADEVIH